MVNTTYSGFVGRSPFPEFEDLSKPARHEQISWAEQTAATSWQTYRTDHIVLSVNPPLARQEFRPGATFRFQLQLVDPASIVRLEAQIKGDLNTDLTRGHTFAASDLYSHPPPATSTAPPPWREGFHHFTLSLPLRTSCACPAASAHSLPLPSCGGGHDPSGPYIDQKTGKPLPNGGRKTEWWVSYAIRVEVWKKGEKKGRFGLFLPFNVLSLPPSASDPSTLLSPPLLEDAGPFLLPSSPAPSASGSGSKSSRWPSAAEEKKRLQLSEKEKGKGKAKEEEAQGDELPSFESLNLKAGSEGVDGRRRVTRLNKGTLADLPIKQGFKVESVELRHEIHTTSHPRSPAHKPSLLWTLTARLSCSAHTSPSSCTAKYGTRAWCAEHLTAALKSPVEGGKASATVRVEEVQTVLEPVEEKGRSGEVKVKQWSKVVYTSDTRVALCRDIKYTDGVVTPLRGGGGGGGGGGDAGAAKEGESKQPTDGGEERAGDVQLEFEGYLVLLHQQGREEALPARVRTCQTELRYDLLLTLTLPWLPSHPLTLRARDIRVDLTKEEAALLLGAQPGRALPVNASSAAPPPPPPPPSFGPDQPATQGEDGAAPPTYTVTAGEGSTGGFGTAALDLEEQVRPQPGRGEAEVGTGGTGGTGGPRPPSPPPPLAAVPAQVHDEDDVEGYDVPDSWPAGGQGPVKHAYTMHDMPGAYVDGSDSNGEGKGKGKEPVGEPEVVGAGVGGQREEGWNFDGFTVNWSRPIEGVPLLPGTTVRFRVRFERPEMMARFEAKMVGRCTVNGTTSCTILSHGPTVFTPPINDPTLLYWDVTIPRTMNACALTPNPLPLPSSSAGVAGGQVGGKTWEGSPFYGGKSWDVKYWVEFSLTDHNIELLYINPVSFHVARATPLLETCSPRLASLPDPKDIRSADKIDYSWIGADVIAKRVLKWDLESSDATDLRIKQIELRHRITTPSDNVTTTTSATSPASPHLTYRLSVSFGTRRYPSVQPFQQRLAVLDSSVTLKVERVTTTTWMDGYKGGQGKEQVREGLLVRDPNASGLEAKGKGKGGDGAREVRNERSEVRCEIRMVNGDLRAVNGKGGKDVRAEDVALVFEGNLDIVPREGEKVQRVRTCLIEVRYDITATFSLTTFSPTSPPILETITATDIRLDLPSDLASPSYNPSAPPPAPSGVAVDAERYPALAALYGGTRPQAGPSSSGGARPEGLPAYEAGDAAPPFPRDEKNPAGPSSPVPDAPAPPPEYTAPHQPPVSISAASAPPPAFSAASPSSSSSQVVGSDHPPTWEETVREDMAEEWVAASAVYGEGNRRER
ncbi:hypothetical protein JCM6882_007990 [Rhodosporidiobolus microsporus]